jgi:hypothetical protein
MNKNDLHNIEHLYFNIIEEGKRGHGEMKDVLKLLQDGFDKGLYKIQETSSGWRLLSNVSKDIETIHKGERALHYLRRFINKLESLKS